MSRNVKTVVFYISKTPAEDRTLITVGGTRLWVRAEESDYGVVAALDNAEPRNDEEILNTYEVELGKTTHKK